MAGQALDYESDIFGILIPERQSKFFELQNIKNGVRYPTIAPQNCMLTEMRYATFNFQGV